jgi:hypothetical protein
MKTLLTILILFFGLLSYSQPYPLPIKSIKYLEQRSFFCFDSSGKKTTLCSLDLDGFDVEFYKAFLNNKTSEVRLVGRLNPSHAFVGIYLGTSDSINSKSPISCTSYDKANISNDGFFDITFKVLPGTVLYFYETQFLPRQFNISKVLNL